MNVPGFAATNPARFGGSNFSPAKVATPISEPRSLALKYRSVPRFFAAESMGDFVNHNLLNFFERVVFNQVFRYRNHLLGVIALPGTAFAIVEPKTPNGQIDVPSHRRQRHCPSHAQLSCGEPPATCGLPSTELEARLLKRQNLSCVARNNLQFSSKLSVKNRHHELLDGSAQTCRVWRSIPAGFNGAQAGIGHFDRDLPDRLVTAQDRPSVAVGDAEFAKGDHGNKTLF